MNQLKPMRPRAQSELLRQLLGTALYLSICCLPMAAQFAGGTTMVDPTAGAQTLSRNIVDGILYIVAGASFVCFCWGVFHLFGPRKMEGILEVCIGLIVMGIIGHALGWDAALTGQLIG